MAWRGMNIHGMPLAVHRVWPLLVIRGALMAAFGILTLVWPALSAVVLISVFGAYAAVDGVITIGYGIRSRRSGGGGQGWLLQGAITVAAGLIALFWPAATASVVLILLGFWALLIGVVILAVALRLRRTSPQVWLLPFVLGVAGVIFGMVLIVEPADALIALAAVLGVLTLISGALLIYGGLRLRRIQVPG